MVSTGQEPQAGNSEHHPERLTRPHPQWHALNILLLIVLLGLFLLSFSFETNYESGIQRLNFVLGDHPVLEMRPGNHETQFVAIIVHGFGGSKDLMSTFGTELAHAGITTYILDLPGYGESSTPADFSSATSNLQENVAALNDLIGYVRAPKPTPTPTPAATTPAATPRPQSTATSQAQATTSATSQVQDTTTATSQAQANAAATSQAQANASATSQAQHATATVQAQNTPTPAQNTATGTAPAQSTPATQPATSPSPRIILVGHSMGAATVSSYLMKHPKDSDDIIASVLLSPTSQAALTTTFPRNLLLLTGQNDLSDALNASLSLFNSACPPRNRIHAPQTHECGKVDDDTGRRLVILPGLDHITILNANTTFQEMLSWLHRVEPRIPATDIHADSRLLGLILGTLSIVLALFPLCSLLIDIFSIRATIRVTSGVELFLFFVVLLLGIAVALAVQVLWRPMSFLHLAIADYVVGYLFIIALVMTLLLILLRRRLPLPPFSQVAQQVLAGIIPATLLYLTLGQLVTFTWQRITLNWPRLLDFVIIAVLLLPIFLIEEGIIRGYHSKNIVRTIIADLAFKALIIGGLFVSPLISTETNLGFLDIVLPVLALVLVLLSGVCSQYYHSGRAALAGGIFSALIIAWCLSTTFPII